VDPFPVPWIGRFFLCPVPASRGSAPAATPGTWRLPVRSTSWSTAQTTGRPPRLRPSPNHVAKSRFTPAVEGAGPRGYSVAGRRIGHPHHNIRMVCQAHSHGH